MKEIAIDYLTLGYSVIPLGSISRDIKTGKKIIQYPKEGWKSYQTKRATEEEIKKWKWPNLGIVTGKLSGLMVLDTDMYKPTYDMELIRSFNLPVTPVQQTPSGGRQYFFKHPQGITLKNTVALGHEGSGIDIRGDGGMVIAPPSKTSYGEYSWIVSPFDTPLADIPPILYELLKKEHSDESKVRKTLPELLNISQGGRDTAMTSLVGKLMLALHENQWESEVWPAMQSFNATYAPPLTQVDLKKIYNSVASIELTRRKKNDPQEEKIFVPALSFAELMGQDFPKARYAIEPFFESGTVNMVSAPPNTWKSWLLFYFSSHIAQGTSVFKQDKFATEKSKVMIVNEEDSYRSVQDRFKILGITDSSLEIYFRIAQGSKLEEKFTTELLKELKEKDIKVVIFDSLRAMHEADENDSTAMQKILDQMKKISREGITVIFTHHHRKKGLQDRFAGGAESSRGSSAINAAISGHISLDEKQKNDDLYLVIQHLKSKAGEKIAPFEVKIEKKINGTTIDFVYGGEVKSEDKKMLQAKDLIVQFLQKEGDWKTVKDFEVLECGENTIRQALAVLKNEGAVISLTRAQAISKKISVPLKGRGNVFGLNTEGIDAVVNSEEIENDAFANF